MNTISMNIVYSNLITKNFKDYLDRFGMDVSEFKKAKTTETIFDVIWAIIGPFQTASQVNIYSLSGNMIGSGLFNMETKVNLSEKSWYENTLSRGGSKYIGKPELMPFIDIKYSVMKTHKFLSLCRMFISDRFVVEGIVEVLQDQETVFSHTSLIKRLNKNISVYVLNSDGALLYPDDEAEYERGQYFNKMIVERRLTPLNVLRLPGNNKADSSVVSYIHSDYTDWDIIVSEPSGSVYEPIYHVTFLLIASSVALIFLGWVISWVTARFLVTPLKKLQHALSEIDADHLSAPDFRIPAMARHPIKEIEALNFSFRKMQDTLKQSTNNLLVARAEETKAKMLALQSLMNPHFVYNNLATISSMAEEGQTVEIVAVCQDISQILRYSSGDSGAAVNLLEEIGHTERYLNCMKVRFGNDLSYLIDFPESMYGIETPKLIVQPIVENSIKHGFNIVPPWRISITGYLEEGEWRLAVEDNGIGFTPESLALLKNRIQESVSNGVVLPYGIEGIGLLNIYLRMKILYGSACFFEVTEGALGGARVTIGGFLG